MLSSYLKRIYRTTLESSINHLSSTETQTVAQLFKRRHVIDWSWTTKGLLQVASEHEYIILCTRITMVCSIQENWKQSHWLLDVGGGYFCEKRFLLVIVHSKLGCPLFALENITTNKNECQGKHLLHLLVLQTLQKTCKTNLDLFSFW